MNYDAIEALIGIEGFDTYEEFLEEYVIESVIPGICTQCHYTTFVEPDQDRGWCEECKANTVQSGLILGGVI